MTLEIALVLLIIGIAVFLFVKEWFSVDVVSVMVMLAFIVTGILTPEQGFSGFNNPATITVGAMFVLSAAVFKSGVLNNFGNLLNSAARFNYTFCLLIIMSISAGLSAFINDTAVVALLMPVVIEVCRETKINPSRLLMPLSFGALMGGVCTLVGTSTNILVSGIAATEGLDPIGMFELTEAGLWFLGAGIVYMIFAGQFLLPKRQGLESLDESYDMGDYLTEIKLLPKSKSVGSPVAKSQLVKDIDIEILEITRENGEVLPAFAYVILEANDTLKVRCHVDKLKKLADQEGIELRSDEKGSRLHGLQIFEALISTNSSFIGKSLAELNFRYAYNGTSVLAIRHRDDIIHEKMADVKLQAGDILLLRAEREQMGRLRKSDDLLVISETKQKKFDIKRIFSVLVVVTGVIATSALGILPIVLSAPIGVLVLIAFRFLTPDEAYKAIEWKVIFMIAGVLSMGMALEKTGAAALMSYVIVNSLGGFGPQVVLSIFFLLTFLTTNVMTNNAAAALLAPIAIATAQAMTVSPRPFLMAVTFAASLSFMTPMSYQTNTMIYAPGNYRFKDYLRVGTPLNIILWIIATFVIPIYFPF